MMERQKWQGQLIEKRLEANELESRLASMRSLLRDHLNPHQPLAEIKFDVVAGVAAGAMEIWEKYCRVLMDIEQLKLSLGEK